MVTATPATTSATLNWSADINATRGYEVAIYNDSSGSSVKQVYTVAYTTSYSEVITSLTASTQYWFRVAPIIDSFGDPDTSCSIQTVTTTA